jgi:carbonic anhydrase/acetyltransferase-like protein (isoleucine patch superfamily)
MIFSSSTKKPKIHSSAYVAATAVISGDVTIGAGCAILHGAVITAEGTAITIGADTVVMENAVIKSSGGAALKFPVSIGNGCIVGPQSYIVGAKLGDGCYVSSGAKLYNGVSLPNNSHVKVNEVRHPQGDFFETVFNLDASADVGARAAQAYSKFLRKAHAQDTSSDVPGKSAPRRSAGEEPPPQQMAEVGGVVDAMMLELQEMEQRRADALKKKRPGS